MGYLDRDGVDHGSGIFHSNTSVAGTIEQALVFDIDHEGVVAQEVSSHDRLLDTSHYETPAESPSKTKVESEPFLSISGYC